MVRWHKGVSLPEFLIVATIIAVIIVSLTPFFLDANLEDDEHCVRHNLQKLRSEIERYRVDHAGLYPARLEDLIRPSNAGGEIGEAGHADADYPIAPYLRSIPENCFSTTAGGFRNRVKPITSDPPTLDDLTPNNAGGWLYNSQTGGVWIDHDQHHEF